MLALRTTRPPVPAAWVRRALLALALPLTGCGSPTPQTASPPPASGVGTDDPAWVTLRTRMPAPDTDRMSYDEGTRTLALYELPGNDRWMVQVSDDLPARPAAPQQRVPTDADLNQMVVYYVRPGMKPSAPVTVKQVRDLGRAHSSLAMMK